MTMKLSRRSFGGLLGGAAMASTFASVGRAAGGSMRLIWWGNPERDKRTNAVIDLFQQASGDEVLPETYAWGDYWQKLATQAAGQNLPDVVQMDYRYIFEWARRNQLAALERRPRPVRRAVRAEHLRALRPAQAQRCIS